MTDFQQADRVLPGPAAQAVLLYVIIHGGGDRKNKRQHPAQANGP